ncbi:MAG: type III pantothenate kinase [Clostridium fessum]
MILAIDVGNTNIIIGVIDAKKTYFVERITTTIGKPNLEYAVALKSILEIYHIAPDQLMVRSSPRSFRRLTGRFLPPSVK